MTTTPPEPREEHAPDRPNTDRTTPHLMVRNNRGLVRGASAAYQNWAGNYFIDWGDGTSRTWASGAAGRFYNHTYAEPGAYMVAVITEGTTVPAAYAQVWIRGGKTPQFTVEPVEGQDGLAELMLTDTPASMIGDFLVDWGDGTAEQQHMLRTGMVIQRRYAKAGTYNVQLTDEFTNRFDSKQVTVTYAPPDPDLAVAKGDTDMTVKLTITPADKSKKLSIDWDDYTAFEDVPAGGGTKDHVFAEEYRNKTVYITVAYEDGSNLNIAEVTLPLAA